MRKKAVEYIIVVLVLSPLLFINIRDSHNWGDDFAGYLTEARNIASGKPFYETKMVPQDYRPSYAPQYYSYGFPLLLAPVVRAFGIDFRALDIYMSLWLVAWALLVFYYLRSRFSFFTAIGFVFIFFVNPFFFKYKTKVLADIPFSFFFTLCMLFFIRRRERHSLYQVAFGVLMAFTIGIRDLGFLFPLFVIAEMCILVIQSLAATISRADFRRYILHDGAALLTAIAVVLFAHFVLFPDPGMQIRHFADLYRSASYWDIFIFNLNVYTDAFESLFRHEVGRYTFALPYATAFMLVMFVLGYIHSIYTDRRRELLLLTVYGIVVLLFPFSSQGFRYLLPVLPVMMMCVIYGARSLTLPLWVNRQVALAVFLLFMSLINIKDIHAMQLYEHSVISPGPMTIGNRIMLGYLKNNIPDSAVIAALKPRAIQLFTDKRTCLIPENVPLDTVLNEMKKVKPDYLLHIQDQRNNIVNDLAASRRDSLVWEDRGNKLYKCAKPD